MSDITSSQTIGLFPHEAWRWAFAPASGEVVISGRVLDGNGLGVDDALLEAWVPNGSATVPGLPGLQRVPSGERGEFRLALPRPAPGAPALYLTVFARGLLKHQFSAVFLADNAPDDSPLLAQVPAGRRATLLAQREGDAYRWDLRLQGADETVFFDFE